MFLQQKQSWSCFCKCDFIVFVWVYMLSLLRAENQREKKTIWAIFPNLSPGGSKNPASLQMHQPSINIFLLRSPISPTFSVLPHVIPAVQITVNI